MGGRAGAQLIGREPQRAQDAVVEPALGIVLARVAAEREAQVGESPWPAAASGNADQRGGRKP